MEEQTERHRLTLSGASSWASVETSSWLSPALYVARLSMSKQQH